MNNAKRAKEVSQGRPNAFNRIRVDFVKAIAICVSRPLAIFMNNDLIGALNRGIPTSRQPFVYTVAVGSVN